MADARTCEPLATSLNGVVTPLYFDRQVVRADDLTLDRSSHDAELARMRRLLHGWGIVAGFALMDADGESKALKVTNGYGITPNGNEVYLTEAVELSNLADALALSCGSGMPGCDIVDIETRKRMEDLVAEGVQGWLVARPYARNSDLRPGVPDGCAHPANTLLPSRRCEGVTFDIVCGLDFPHIRDPLSCETLTEWICKPDSEAQEPLPLPAPVEVCDDYLVIGRIAVSDGVLRTGYEDRRPLFPVSLLQDWLTACMCGPRFKPRAEPPPRKEDDGVDTTHLPDPVDEKSGFGLQTWAQLNKRAVANGLGPADGLTLNNQQKLTAAGFDGPAKLLAADLDKVSLASGLPRETLEAMRGDALKKQFLIKGPQI